MECVKSADILKPAKSAAKGLMAVISGDKGGGGYVRQMIAKDCPQTSSGMYIASVILEVIHAGVSFGSGTETMVRGLC